jgi:hypothetical protein
VETRGGEKEGEEFSKRLKAEKYECKRVNKR